MEVQETLQTLGYVFLVLCLVMIVASAIMFFRFNIRAIRDDLSGKSRSRALGQQGRTAASRRRSGSRRGRDSNAWDGEVKVPGTEPAPTEPAATEAASGADDSETRASSSGMQADDSPTSVSGSRPQADDSPTSVSGGGVQADGGVTDVAASDDTKVAVRKKLSDADLAGSDSVMQHDHPQTQADNESASMNADQDTSGSGGLMAAFYDEYAEDSWVESESAERDSRTNKDGMAFGAGESLAADENADARTTLADSAKAEERITGELESDSASDTVVAKPGFILEKSKVVTGSDEVIEVEWDERGVQDA